MSLYHNLLLAKLERYAPEKRLSYATLADANQNVRRPNFNPAALRSGILHIGCGVFHRGHQAVATQRAIEAEGVSGLRWGIASASMKRRTIPDQLVPQNGLYTLLERSVGGVQAEIIGTLREVFHAPSDLLGLPARIANPNIRIVTLTVTAPGYLLAPATGQLQKTHRDVVYDLQHPEAPRSAIGAITYGLNRIRRTGGIPPVIITCDNVSNNGTTLRRAVVNFAAMHTDGLAAWIEHNVCFPNTMVDRIVPISTSVDREDAKKALGFRDAGPISAEPYLQWIIEDFDGQRPRWEAAGARFVSDVKPFELAKLRLLNGAHMLLAYIGALAGFKTIAETMADPLMAAFTEAFMLREQGPTLEMNSAELHLYVAKTMVRLRNPAIRHEVGRVGQNGSAKLAARLMQPLRQNLLEGRSGLCSLLVIAAWIRWFALRDIKGTQVQLIDEKTEEIKALCEEVGEDHLMQADAFLRIEDIFGPGMPNHAQVVIELARALRDLHLYPVHDVVRSRLADIA